MRIFHDRKAVSVASVILLAISFMLVAILTPIAMQQVVGANTTGWDTATKTIFATLLPLLFIVGVAVRFIPKAKGD